MGSLRHIDFHVRVAKRCQPAARPPLAIGLVLDRSGSMSGQKIETARQAALAVLERLTPNDRVAAAVFDNQVDLLQDRAPATPEVKARLRAELTSVQARGGTALHEGWISGCRAIAPRTPEGTLTRCLLLTDGLANVGLTDAEQITAEAARVRAHAGVGTSTFGIGEDYAETLLGPMAVAGGGQFHHLRSPADIASTFVGELNELFAVAALDVYLSIEADDGTAADVVSPYWPQRTGDATWSVPLGDLLHGEERHLVVRFAFDRLTAGGDSVVRARLKWRTPDGAQHEGAGQQVRFEMAESSRRAAEVADLAVLRLVGAHHADRTRRLAIARSRDGDVSGAVALLHTVAARIARYAGTDAALLQTLAELRSAERDLQQFGYQAARRKEEYFQSQMRARGQRDLRPDRH
jgi:Ca-activated chloride channel family protein